ncbi:hypothetical protein BOTBODRAFT_633840 [Botryobasidium botryosum FD-172 SS1]|uniref:Uncharacterized protein n=1 Tax=Botryobasidium botryosum (strain FD-172 SS1) TaxID=930990 RepID=A0A067MB19_BOTB1|nr:hypothetical protein BOTBODRAFT_633840 [Botryobasidium botryosum FD-172 SS1]
MPPKNSKKAPASAGSSRKGAPVSQRETKRKREGKDEEGNLRKGERQEATNDIAEVRALREIQDFYLYFSRNVMYAWPIESLVKPPPADGAGYIARLIGHDSSHVQERESVWTSKIQTHAWVQATLVKLPAGRFVPSNDGLRGSDVELFRMVRLQPDAGIRKVAPDEDFIRIRLYSMDHSNGEPRGEADSFIIRKIALVPRTPLENLALASRALTVRALQRKRTAEKKRAP